MKIRLFEEKMKEEIYTKEELLEVFNYLNLDTGRYTFKYLAEQMGFQPLKEIFGWFKKKEKKEVEEPESEDSNENPFIGPNARGVTGSDYTDNEKTLYTLQRDPDEKDVQEYVDILVRHGADPEEAKQRVEGILKTNKKTFISNLHFLRYHE